MKKLMTMIMLGASVFIFTGCGEKSEKEQLGDATEQMQKDAEKAARAAEKEAEKAAEEGEKKLEGLLGN